jgi:VanZ family protein
MRRRWIWVVGYVGLIFSLSSIRHLGPPSGIENADKVAHFLEYFVLGVLLTRAWMGSSRHGSALRSWVLAVVTGALIAALDEIYQGTVGRQQSAADWAADIVGLIAGGGLVALGYLDRILNRIHARTERKKP